MSLQQLGYPVLHKYAFLNGQLVAKLSPGLDHPTKTKFGMTVNGSTIDFDN